MAARITLHPGRDKSLNQKHPWVFSKAVMSVSGRAGKGDTVDVFSHEGKWLARGAYSPDSQMRVRVWTFNQAESVDHVFFMKRLQLAKRLRDSLALNTNAYRLVAAESDGLPGITIDVYDQVAVLQLLSAGAEKNRDKLVAALEKLQPWQAIYERSDVAVREKEGLEQTTGLLKGEMPNLINIHENGLQLSVDVIHGHKTGYYLDQRDSRATAQRYAVNKSVLNCFSYTSTFACAALAGGATHVTNVDVSSDALNRGTQHLQMNGFSDNQYTQHKADVFEALRRYKKTDKQFDMVILDPPKFVESKNSLQRAARGYKDINMYGIHAVKEGGLLFTFSCSGLMPTDLFQKIVADAALDANKQLKIIERLGQAPDHPVLSSYPQGHYLKGLVCEVTHV